MHPIRVAEEVETRVHFGGDAPAEFIAFSADDDGLRVGAELHEAIDDELGGPNSERAGGQQQRGFFRMQTELRADGGAVDGLGEYGVDRDTGDGDAFGGEAEGFEVRFGFVDGDEVAIEDAREPHGVAVEIGDDDGMVRVEFLSRDEMRDDSGGHEVRADGDLRVEVADHFHERARVEAVELQAEVVAFPRLVARFVSPAEHVRRAADEFHVKRGVKFAEDRGGEIERVGVFHRGDSGFGGERFFERLRGADVASAGAGGEDEDALLHGGREAGRLRNDETQMARRSEFVTDLLEQLAPPGDGRQRKKSGPSRNYAAPSSPAGLPEVRKLRHSRTGITPIRISAMFAMTKVISQ